MRAHLSPEQIAEALIRHGYEPATELAGITYRGEVATLHTRAGESLVVPDDVLTMPAPMPTESRQMLFSRPD